MADDSIFDFLDDDSDFLASNVEDKAFDIDLDEFLAELDADRISIPDDDFMVDELPKIKLPDDSVPVRKPVPPEPKRVEKRQSESKPAAKMAAVRKPVNTKKADPEESYSANPFMDWLASHKRIINVALFAIALALLAGIGMLFWIQENADPYDGRIIPNVKVAGVDVGGMTVEEATQVVRTSAIRLLADQDIVVHLGHQELILPAAKLNTHLNVEAAVQSAYAYGRTGSVAERQNDYRAAQMNPYSADLSSYMTVDESYIRTALQDAVSKLSGTYSPSGYRLEGARPDLDADSFNAAAPCQTLVLTLGTPGSDADLNSIFNAVMNEIHVGSTDITIDSSLLPQMPAKLDLNAIYNEIAIAPIEASQDPSTQEILNGSVGYQFSLNDAQTKLSTAVYGDTISIPMEYVMPSVLDIRGDYPEILAIYSTPVSNNSAYNENMAILCKALDGIVVPAGGYFSFNATMPVRTTSNGFQIADEHANACTLQVLGGGTDQVASTLYVCAEYAGLNIVQRNNCDHVCPYTIRGAELSVNQSWKDLKFQNKGTDDVIIRAKVTDTQVVIRILGKQPLGHTVKLESQDGYARQFTTSYVDKLASDGFTDGQILIEGVPGGSLQLYRVEYDSNSGAELSRRSVCYVELAPVTQVIARVK